MERKLRSGKIVLIGDGACGKTCLLEVFKRNKFPEEYIPTVVDNFIKVVEFDGERHRSVSLALWDTAGQDDYDTIRPLSYRETDLVLLCYAINNKKNIDNIEKKWLMEIKNYCPNAKYFLVALKKDLRGDPEALPEELITEDEGKEIARKIRAEKFFECSALKRINVNEVFEAAAKYIYYNAETVTPKDMCSCCNIFTWCCY
jgi:Ras family protein A